MFKKLITTIPATSDSGMLCADCKFVRAILQFDGDVREYCNYYEKTCDSNKPIWCKVELIEVTEGIGPGPGPVYVDRNCERIQELGGKSKEIMENLDFMIRTCREAARSVKQELLPAIEKTYQDLVKMVEDRWEQEKIEDMKK